MDWSGIRIGWILDTVLWQDYVITVTIPESLSSHSKPAISCTKIQMFIFNMLRWNNPTINEMLTIKGAQIHRSIWHAMEISKLLASTIGFNQKQCDSGTSTSALYWNSCCTARCGLTRGFMVLCKVRIIPSDIKTGNFPAALGIFELLHLRSSPRPLLLFPVCPSHSQWGSHKPAQSQLWFSAACQRLHKS